MSGGDIAAIIAASAFALLVIVMVPSFMKLSKLVDETRVTVRDLNDNLGPLLSELTDTMAVVNDQVIKIDKITSNVKNVTGNIDNLVDIFASALGSPLFKVAGIGRGIFKFLNNQKQSRSKRSKND
jgi:uncharacterized protein YoxC